MVQLLLKEQGEEDKFKIFEKRETLKHFSVWGIRKILDFSLLKIFNFQTPKIFRFSSVKISYKEETNWLEKNLYIAVIL